MKRISIYTLFFMCATLFIGCVKDNELVFNVDVERLGSDSKMYIDDNYACWDNNDDVKINSTTTHVSLAINNSKYQATISGVPVAGDENYYAIYPASYCASTFLNGASITLPNSVNYAETQGHQIIKAPMCAYVNTTGSDGNVMKFKNICTLLKIHVAQTNNIATSIVVESSTVNLSGSAIVSFDDSGNPTLGSITSGSKWITLDLGSGVSLNVAGGRDFYVPIPSIASGTDLKITINDKFSQSYVKQITSTNTVPVNTIISIASATVNPNDDFEFFDYVESRGSGYIELTNQKPTRTSKFELTYSLLPSGVSTSQYLCGSRGTTGSDNTTQWFTLTGPAGKNYFQGTFNTKQAQNHAWIRESGVKYRTTMEILPSESQPLKYYGRVTFEKLGTSNSVVASHIVTTEDADAPASNANNICLFSLRNDGDVHAGMRCYGFRSWDNGILKADFVPCKRKADSAKGVYDMQSGQFIPLTQKAGATLFVLGND